MSADVGDVEDGEGQSGKAVHVYFVEGESCSCVGGVVACALHL